jgi:hypothetical protein
MYGMVQQEDWRQYPEEIRREVALIRLEKAALVNREGGSGLWRDLSWELARFAGLLSKRLRRSV